jgi:hypothetical protein
VSAPQLPVGRSNTVRVQVQGCELVEALDFIRDSLKANRNRKLAQIATQFTTLISQIESLGTPLDVGYMRKSVVKNNRRGDGGRRGGRGAGGGGGGGE